MAKSFVKVNNEIRNIDRAAVKDQNGDYRIVKNIYAKVNVGGGVFWEKVLTSNPVYALILENGILNVCSAIDFEVVTTIDFTSYSIDKIIYSNNYAYFHEHDGATIKMDLKDFLIIEDYAGNWRDVGALEDGSLYFLTSNSISVIDSNEVTTTYNATLQSGEEFTRFCVDTEGFCYCLTTNERLIKINTVLQQVEYSISISGYEVSLYDNPSVDDNNFYCGTGVNIALFINKNSGQISIKILSFSRTKKIKTDNVEFFYSIFEESGIAKFSMQNGAMEDSFQFGTGYFVTDMEISYNGNIYAIAQNDINYKFVKLDNNFQIIFEKTLTKTNDNHKLSVFPGNFGGGFWNKYIQ